MEYSQIKILEPQVIDQIAAGEVIERPAQMVKELVENALDAGASEIEVDFDQGGKFVQVKDNGKGISQEELPLAIARHATSKITNSQDLWSLNSFGFRGEALASLSAVAHVTITSRFTQSNTAYQIQSEWGKLSSVEEASHERGTTVRVEGLFKNTPARLKFLKSDAAEHMQIKKVLKAMALSRPEVSFRVRQGAQMLFYWPQAENWLERAKAVLENQELFEVAHEFNGVQLKAALSSPNNTSRTNKNIWLFVQNRWVQDRSLQAALMDGYRSFLMHGEYPYAALFVTVAPENVDVNIHPTKSQVKFLNASDAYRTVLRATKNLMDQAPWLEGLKVKPVLDSLAPTDAAPETYTPQFNEPAIQRPQFAHKTFSIQDLETSYDVYKQPTENPVPNLAPLAEEKPLSPPPATENRFWQNLQLIGQAGLTYVVAQNSESLILIDQHAAHERVAYERLMQQWRDKNIEVQNYLLPESIELEEAEVEAVLKVKEDLESLGLYIDQGGPNHLVVRAAPLLIKAKSIKLTLEKTAEDVMSKTTSFAFESLVRDLCATMACHSVVRAGQALSLEQMQSLLVQMDEFYASSFCPHGRPVYVEYPFSRIERDFGRIV